MVFVRFNVNFDSDDFRASGCTYCILSTNMLGSKGELVEHPDKDRAEYDQTVSRGLGCWLISVLAKKYNCDDVYCDEPMI